MSLTPVDLREAGERFTRRVYHEILSPAFPPHELDSEDMFLADIRAAEVVGLALADDAGMPLSAIVGYPYLNERVLLIGYLATRRDRRSHGLGARLLELAADRWYSAERYDLVLAEIDDPRFHPGEDATKRLRFYERNGAVLLERPYFQPRLRPGASRVYGMLLIAQWRAPGAMVGEAVRREPVLAFLCSYFTQSEGALDGDPELVRLVAAYQASDVIPVCPLSAYTGIDQILPGE